MKREIFRATRGLLCVVLLGSLSAPAVARARCSEAMLHGQYGFYRTGNTPAGPLAAIGFILFDGKGNTAGVQNISRNGSYTLDLDMAGPYTVDENCTGKLYTPDGIEIGRLVIVDGGREYYQLSLSNGNAVYGIGKQLDADD
jgi:hypothetical protein